MPEECCTTHNNKSINDKKTKGLPQPCQRIGTLAAAIEHVGAGFDVPWWGFKWSQNLKNAGYVIGFKHNASAMRHWHLDYDPAKGLHINYEDKTGKEALKTYHKITNLASLAGLTLPDGNKSQEDNQHAMWLHWSRLYIATNPPSDDQKLEILMARFGAGMRELKHWDVIEGILEADSDHFG